MHVGALSQHSDIIGFKIRHQERKQRAMLGLFKHVPKEERLWLCADGRTLGVLYIIHPSNQTADSIPGKSCLP